MNEDYDSAALEMTSAQLMRQIDYQIFAPPVSTYGMCSECKNNFARGSLVCVECLVKGLGYIVGTKAASKYVEAATVLKEQREKVLLLAKNGQ